MQSEAHLVTVEVVLSVVCRSCMLYSTSGSGSWRLFHVGRTTEQKVLRVRDDWHCTNTYTHQIFDSCAHSALNKMVEALEENRVSNSRNNVSNVWVCTNMSLLSQHLLYAASLDSRHSLGFFLDLLHCSCEQAKVCTTSLLPHPFLSFILLPLSCIHFTHDYRRCCIEGYRNSTSSSHAHSS